MTVRTASICFIGIAGLGIARLVLPERENPTIALSPVRLTKVPRSAPPPQISRSAVLEMGPKEWKERFENEPASYPQPVRTAVTRMATELHELLASGADPAGEDVQVYTDAITALLSSRWEED